MALSCALDAAVRPDLRASCLKLKYTAPLFLSIHRSLRNFALRYIRLIHRQGKCDFVRKAVGRRGDDNEVRSWRSVFVCRTRRGRAASATTCSGATCDAGQTQKDDRDQEQIAASAGECKRKQKETWCNEKYARRRRSGSAIGILRGSGRETGGDLYCGVPRCAR